MEVIQDFICVFPIYMSEFFLYLVFTKSFHFLRMEWSTVETTVELAVLENVWQANSLVTH